MIEHPEDFEETAEFTPEQWASLAKAPIGAGQSHREGCTASCIYCPMDAAGADYRRPACAPPMLPPAGIHRLVPSPTGRLITHTDWSDSGPIHP